MPTVGQRPASISLGTAVSPTPLVLLARLGNPTVTGGVQPAVLTSPLRLIPTLPNPASLVRGHATRIDLVEGTVIRATWFQGITDVFTTYSLTVSQAVLDAIDNWADLRLRVTATGESGRTAISWAELSVPNSAAGLTVSATALRLIPTLPNASVSAGGSPPEAVIGSPPGPVFTVAVGQTITFDPIGTNDDGAWGGTWNFGDGTTHTGTFNNYASHVVNKAYAADGTYLVTWTAIDAEGNTDVATVTVEVTQVAGVPTTLQITPNTFALSPGQQRELSAVVIDQFGNTMAGQVIGWQSNNTSRATVAPSTGAETIVTAGSQTGNVTITASTPPGGAVQGTSAGTIVAASSLFPNLALFPSIPLRAEWEVGSSLPTLGTAVESGFGIVSPPGGRLLLFESASVLSSGMGLVSPSWTFRKTYNAGLPPGSGPGRTAFQPPGSTAVRYNEWYQAIYFKIPDTFGDGMFEAPNVSVGEWKFLGFLGVDVQSNAIYITVRPSGGSGPGVGGSTPFGNNLLANSWSVSIKTQTGEQGASSDPEKAVGSYGPNTGTNVLYRVGREFRLELYIRKNTVGASGNTDGLLRVWLTDLTAGGSPVQTHNYTNFKCSTFYKPDGLWRWWYDPTWGGTGGQNKQRTEHMWIGHCGIAAAGVS